MLAPFSNSSPDVAFMKALSHIKSIYQPHAKHCCLKRLLFSTVLFIGCEQEDENGELKISTMNLPVRPKVYERCCF
jgi:hypothetical protein